MITVRNEFEVVPAYEHIAGSSLGTWSAREVAFRMIETLETVSGVDVFTRLYKELAQLVDDMDDGVMWDIADDTADLLNEHMPMPDYCSVVLQDSEYLVLPDLESAQEECKTYSECPETNEGGENTILVVNDHGNVTCFQWSAHDNDYIPIWDMV